MDREKKEGEERRKYNKGKFASINKTWEKNKENCYFQEFIKTCFKNNFHSKAEEK